MGLSFTAPLAGCDVYDLNDFRRRNISIHAPHAGRDRERLEEAQRLTEFQSTHPLRGATVADDHAVLQRVISIHAPLAGCDFAYVGIF